MQIISVKCESCGASVKIDDESSVFTCEYCGTSLQLMRKPNQNQSAPPNGFNRFTSQLPEFYTKIVSDIKTNAKHIARFAKPFIIIAIIVTFIIIALSIIIPVVLLKRSGRILNVSGNPGSQFPAAITCIDEENRAFKGFADFMNLD